MPESEKLEGIARLLHMNRDLNQFTNVTQGQSWARERLGRRNITHGTAPAGLSRGAVISAPGGPYDGLDREEGDGPADPPHRILRHPEGPHEGGDPRVLRLQRGLVPQDPRSLLSDGAGEAAEEVRFRPRPRLPARGGRPPAVSHLHRSDAARGRCDPRPQADRARHAHDALDLEAVAIDAHGDLLPERREARGVLRPARRRLRPFRIWRPEIPQGRLHRDPERDYIPDRSQLAEGVVPPRRVD